MEPGISCVAVRKQADGRLSSLGFDLLKCRNFHCLLVPLVLLFAVAAVRPRAQKATGPGSRRRFGPWVSAAGVSRNQGECPGH